MKFDIVKFERGQVWMIRFKYPEQVGHEQKKDRPWLVLSVGNYNESAGMITCVPLTSREYIRTPSQVAYDNQRGTKGVILCEQIRSFDYKSGNYIFDFMGNISTEVLEKVDVALSIHLGMHYSPITLKQLYNSIESIVKSIDYMGSSNTPKFTDDDVIKFAEKLQEYAITSQVVSTVSDVSPEETHTVGEDAPSSVVAVKKRGKWTRENIHIFLEDYQNLSTSSMMEKYDIDTKEKLYQKKHYIKKLLDGLV